MFLRGVEQLETEYHRAEEAAAMPEEMQEEMHEAEEAAAAAAAEGGEAEKEEGGEDEEDAIKGGSQVRPDGSLRLSGQEGFSFSEGMLIRRATGCAADWFPESRRGTWSRTLTCSAPFVCGQVESLLYDNQKTIGPLQKRAQAIMLQLALVERKEIYNAQLADLRNQKQQTMDKVLKRQKRPHCT